MTNNNDIRQHIVQHLMYECAQDLWCDRCFELYAINTNSTKNIRRMKQRARKFAQTTGVAPTMCMMHRMMQEEPDGHVYPIPTFGVQQLVMLMDLQNHRMCGGGLLSAPWPPRLMPHRKTYHYTEHYLVHNIQRPDERPITTATSGTLFDASKHYSANIELFNRSRENHNVLPAIPSWMTQRVNA
jgi:hypothetical protein